MTALFRFSLILSIFQDRSIQILFIYQKINIFHLLPKIMKNDPNFNLILSSEINVGAKHKFFTLASNNLKAISANQGNYVD